MVEATDITIYFAERPNFTVTAVLANNQEIRLNCIAEPISLLENRARELGVYQAALSGANSRENFKINVKVGGAEERSSSSSSEVRVSVSGHTEEEEPYSCHIINKQEGDSLFVFNAPCYLPLLTRFAGYFASLVHNQRELPFTKLDQLAEQLTLSYAPNPEEGRANESGLNVVRGLFLQCITSQNSVYCAAATYLLGLLFKVDHTLEVFCPNPREPEFESLIHELRNPDLPIFGGRERRGTYVDYGFVVVLALEQQINVDKFLLRSVIGAPERFPRVLELVKEVFCKKGVTFSETDYELVKRQLATMTDRPREWCQQYQRELLRACPSVTFLISQLVKGAQHRDISEYIQDEVEMYLRDQPLTFPKVLTLIHDYASPGLSEEIKTLSASGMLLALLTMEHLATLR